MARPSRTYDLEKGSPPPSDLEIVAGIAKDATLAGVDSGFKKGLRIGLVAGIIAGYFIRIVMETGNAELLDTLTKLLKLIP